ncbi:hypothetical protein ACWGR3_30795, partial [Streptomyces albidoflavus]
PEQTRLHGLFQASRSVLVFDEHVREDQLAGAGLVLVAGSRLPAATRAALRRRADAGATVLIARWLCDRALAESSPTGAGRWVVYDSLDEPDAQEVLAAHAGPPDLWTQRFGGRELRIRPGDSTGETLDFEVADARR